MDDFKRAGKEGHTYCACRDCMGFSAIKTQIKLEKRRARRKLKKEVKENS